MNRRTAPTLQLQVRRPPTGEAPERVSFFNSLMAPTTSLLRGVVWRRVIIRPVFEHISRQLIVSKPWPLCLFGPIPSAHRNRELIQSGLQPDTPHSPPVFRHRLYKLFDTLPRLHITSSRGRRREPAQTSTARKSQSGLTSAATTGLEGSAPY
jgi:hypothetical protein